MGCWGGEGSGVTVVVGQLISTVKETASKAWGYTAEPTKLNEF